jgi:hypothetical protein
VVGRRIERVVDRHAAPGAEPGVAVDHRGAAAVGEHQVELRDQRAERIARLLVDPIEGRRRVDVPEHHQGARRLQLEHAGLEQRVVDADAAGLDHQVGAARLGEDAADPVGGRRIHHHPRPVRIGEVAVLLALERVGLVEGDAMAAASERADDAAVVGRRTVPVGRDQAGAEERDIEAVGHDASLVMIASS